MTSVDLTPILTPLVELAGVGVSVLAGWALTTLTKKFNIQISTSQTALFDDALQKSLAYGVSQSLTEIKDKGWDHLQTQNQVVSLAVNYAVARFPDALATVGVKGDPNSAENRAAITQALTRALPEAFTVAAASPATPPAPPPAPVAVVNETPVSKVAS